MAVPCTKVNLTCGKLLINGSIIELGSLATAPLRGRGDRAYEVFSEWVNEARMRDRASIQRSGGALSLGQRLEVTGGFNL